MKIESVLLENFGLFGGRRYRFDGQPLILIYGANESGKTTTLNGLRQALFGFPHKSAYLTGKPMSAEVTVTLRDGRMVRFARQKKRSDSFVATIDGKIPLEESQWLELAGGLDLKSYQSLFGFSLDELREGEKALAHAPLNEALSGSALGGLARLQHVHERLDSFLSATLKRVGVNGTINAKLAEIEAAEKQLDAVLVLPADIAAFREQYATAQQTVERLSDEVRQLRAQYESWQRRQTALPRAIEYRQIEESLRAYELPAAIDEAFRLQWTVTNNKLGGARNELASEERKLAQLEAQMVALPEAADSGEHHAEIRRLGSEAQQIAERRRLLIEASRECEELERELREALRRLGWSHQDSQWRQIELDLTEQAELEGIRKHSESLATKLAACKTRLEMATKQLATRSTTAEAATPPENLLRLEALVQQARTAEQNCQQHARQIRELANDRQAVKNADQLLHATRQLRSAVDAEVTQLDASWHVPTTESAANHRQRIATLVEQHERFTRELTQSLREIEVVRGELAQAKSTHGLMSPDELEKVWQERDAIVRQWREELWTPLLASTVSIEQQRQRLEQLEVLHAQSDTAVRSMLDSLDRVAAMIAKQQRLERLEGQRTALAAQVSDSLSAVERAQSEWRELWSQCPFIPDAPDQMLGWLENYRSWRVQQAALDRMRGEETALAGALEAAISALHNEWPAPGGQALTLADAEQCLSDWRASAATRAAEQKWIADIQAAHQIALQETQAVQIQFDECQKHYHQTLAALHLPESWPLQEIDARLEALARCRSMASRIDKLQERRESLLEHLNRFEIAVRTHAALLGKPDANHSPEQLATFWLEQLNQQEASVKKRADLASAIAAHTQSVQRRSQQVAELEGALNQQVAQAGATSSDQVQQWIGGASAVFQLRTRQRELSAALETCAAGQPLDEFLAELSAIDEVSVTTTAARLSAQLSSAELALQTAVKELGALTRELQYREQGTAALEWDQRLKRLRSELVELSEQWVVHRMAAELLTRTIDRFTRNHEPQLLKHTRRFFKELTDDRYGFVLHDSGKHGGFAVQDKHGHTWQPDKLSTGTREQLYLAIRLAFITHFNEQREPLPVIMDDCFVNFDDTRARIALRTLIHWQESAQTILLSCHWRSVEALAELAPDTPVITAASGEMTTARQLASQAGAFAT